MKSSKKVLAFALAAAMVVTAVPATNAQAASTAKLSAKKSHSLFCWLQDRYSYNSKVLEVC